MPTTDSAPAATRVLTPTVDPALAPTVRQVLEAMRMGVVPPCGIESFTVGRDREIARVQAMLRDGRGLLIAMGHYGSGKTHLLELSEEAGRRAGFVTSRVTFDPIEVPPSHPARVHREIVARLRYPDHPGAGLYPLLERLRQSKDHGPYGARAHLYLSAALHAVLKADPEAAEEIVAFVSGAADGNADEANRLLRHARYAGPRLYALPDYRTFGQLYAYVLGGIASWAKDAGYGGLLLCFDEAEFYDELPTASRQMAETFLRYLALAALPDDKLAFDRTLLYRGGQESHRRIPERYRADQPLCAIFAFTPLPEVNRAINQALRGRDLVMEIEAIEKDLLPRLADRVVDLYRALHPDGMPPEIPRAARGILARHPPSSTRQAVKTVVELCDIGRILPDRLPKVLAAATA